MPVPDVAQPEYKVGKRYLHAKTLAPLTLRYVGPLPPPAAPAGAAKLASEGFGASTEAGPSRPELWLGVEYDDPTRGKHSGTYEGVRVCETRREGAGAFIRARPGVLVEGKTFVQALEERYGAIIPDEDVRSVPDTSGQTSSGNEHLQAGSPLTLGSSGGAIVVEAPGLEEVKKRVGKLERLREMGLEGEWVSGVGGDAQMRCMMGQRLRGVTTLNLSKNLLASWADVAAIMDVLPGLKTLVLNDSRIGPLPMGFDDALRDTLGPLQRINELHFGRCDVTWDEVSRLAGFLPRLVSLHLTDNTHLRSLDPPNPIILSLAGSFESLLPRLEYLSLEGCGIDAWEDLVKGLGKLPKLVALNISSLPLALIPPPSPSPSMDHPGTGLFPSLTSLILLDSSISAWRDIDALELWTSRRLRSLRFGLRINAPDKAVTSATSLESASDGSDDLRILSDPTAARPVLIAKLSSLGSLNSTPISPAERRDAELYYLSKVEKLPARSSEARHSDWGRHEELCGMYDRKGDEKAEKPKSTTLKSRMINLRIYPAQSPSFSISILPSAPMPMMRKKIARTLCVDAAGVRIWTARGTEGGDSQCPAAAMIDAIREAEQPGTGEKVVEILDEGTVDWWMADGDGLVVET